MKILHIGREENMERYPAPDYIAEEIETVSLPMGKRPEDYLDAMEEAQVIVADAMADVPGALIRKMPHLKMIHSEGVAYNRIDLKTAKEREIYVCNCRGMNASAVAEQTVFLMQGMLKNVLLNDRGVREGRQIQIKEGYMVRGDLKELSDCKAGLIGLGDIGKSTAALLAAYHTETYYYKRHWEDNQTVFKLDSVSFLYIWGSMLTWTTITALCLIIGVLSYSKLPTEIPVQWSKGVATSLVNKNWIFICPVICIIIRYLLKPFIHAKLQMDNYYGEIITEYLTNYMCFIVLSVESFSILFTFGVVKSVVVLLFCKRQIIVR